MIALCGLLLARTTSANKDLAGRAGCRRALLKCLALDEASGRTRQGGDESPVCGGVKRRYDFCLYRQSSF
jgi:hypothetical protein